MRNALKSTIKLMLFSIIVFFFTGCNDVDKVKNGVIQLDKSMTVGNALDKYQYFSSTKWSSGETSQKSLIVECSGYIKNSSMRLIVQFQINKDNTFELAYAGLYQGDKEISSGGESYLINVYRNEVIDNKLLKTELIKNNSPEFIDELYQEIPKDKFNNIEFDITEFKLMKAILLQMIQATDKKNNDGDSEAAKIFLEEILQTEKICSDNPSKNNNSCMDMLKMVYIMAEIWKED